MWIDDMKALVSKVARLNRDAGEIGAGMLCQLVDEARRLMPEDPFNGEFMTDEMLDIEE